MGVIVTMWYQWWSVYNDSMEYILFVWEAVKSWGLGFVKEVMLVNLVSYHVGLYLSRTVVFLALLHDLVQLSIVLFFVIFKFLAYEKKGNVENSTWTCEYYLFSVASVPFLGLGFETSPVAALELIERFSNSLAVKNPVDCADDSVDVEVTFALSLKLVIKIVFVLFSEGVKVGPYKDFYLWEFRSIY